MEPRVTDRQAMILAGLLQGVLLLSLHEWLRAFGYTAPDLAWVAPAYALAVPAPVTFGFPKGEFPLRRSLAGALAASLPFAATAGAMTAFPTSASPQTGQAINPRAR